MNSSQVVPAAAISAGSNLASELQPPAANRVADSLKTTVQAPSSAFSAPVSALIDHSSSKDISTSTIMLPLSMAPPGYTGPIIASTPSIMAPMATIWITITMTVLPSAANEPVHQYVTANPPTNEPPASNPSNAAGPENPRSAALLPTLPLPNAAISISDGEAGAGAGARYAPAPNFGPLTTIFDNAPSFRAVKGPETTAPSTTKSVSTRLASTTRSTHGTVRLRSG